MIRLFVERFAVRAEDDDSTQLRRRYDDAVDYNVTEDGEPYVVAGPHAGTVTLTAVAQETDDADPDPTVTITKVQAESDDRD